MKIRDIYKFKDILLQDILLLLKYILALCSPVHLLKHNIYALFGRLKQYFTCFDCSIIFMRYSVILWKSPPVIQAETGHCFRPSKKVGSINKLIEHSFNK